jgi:hypothetical protein
LGGWRITLHDAVVSFWVRCGLNNPTVEGLDLDGGIGNSHLILDLFDLDQKN